MINIAIMNGSTVLTDQQVAMVVPTLQVQVTRDFYPAWGVDAILNFVAKGASPQSGSWQLVILDDSDQAGALGYHDLTLEGLPIGKVFAKSDIRAGLEWTVTASHELLEMLCDPDINLTVLVGNRLFAYEVADACEAERYGYEVNGLKLSDFVFPSWFETFRPHGTQFDFAGHIKKPLELLPGGYIGYMDIRSAHGWQQKFAETLAGRGAEQLFQEIKTYADRPQPGSRRERRRTPREQWMVSTA